MAPVIAGSIYGNDAVFIVVINAKGDIEVCKIGQLRTEGVQELGVGPAVQFQVFDGFKID